MREFPNIVWILVDSIRTYPTDLDLRGRLPIMDEFARSSVAFETVVTTAPSTIMSITAMMTGLPAYFLARNYDDFRFDGRFYNSLRSILENNGYSTFAFLRGPETREKFSVLLRPVPRRYWPKHLRHGVKWENKELDALLTRVVREGIRRPAFLFFHYNPQAGQIKDYRMSDRVAAVLDCLNEAGFGEDNTIFILCSDHGFPDTKTGIDSDWEIRHRITHDLILTDDNILIPLFIQYPGCKPTVVHTPVSTLDILPTILELADLRVPDGGERMLAGTSLVPLIEKNDGNRYKQQYHRTDSRLMAQRGRSTSIRGHDFKYVRLHDDNAVSTLTPASVNGEVLVDLVHDPNETGNLLRKAFISDRAMAELARMREEFEKTETRAVEYQIAYFLNRNRALFENAHRNRNPKILVLFEPGTAGYADLGLQAMMRAVPQAKFSVLSDSACIDSSPRQFEVERFVYESGHKGRLSIPMGGQLSKRNAYDLSILFVQDPAAPLAGELLNLARQVSAKKALVLDCNFRVYRPRRYWYYRFRALIEKALIAVREPSFLLANIATLGRFLKKHVYMRFGVWEKWHQASMEVQDAE